MSILDTPIEQIEERAIRDAQTYDIYLALYDKIKQRSNNAKAVLCGVNVYKKLSLESTAIRVKTPNGPGYIILSNGTKAMFDMKLKPDEFYIVRQP